MILKEDFLIPGTDIILEAGDIVKIEGRGLVEGIKPMRKGILKEQYDYLVNDEEFWEGVRSGLEDLAYRAEGLDAEVLFEEVLFNAKIKNIDFKRNRRSMYENQIIGPMIDMPYYEDVIRDAAKEAGVTEEQVSSYVTESFFYELINTVLDFSTDMDIVDDAKIFLTSDDRGYNSYFAMEADTRWIIPKNDREIKKELTSKEINEALTGSSAERYGINDAYELGRALIDEELPIERSAELMVLDKEAEKTLKQFESFAVESAKYHGTTEPYVDMIIANRYYEED